MEIHLNDEKPVTYRPYRLAFSERMKVQEMVKELLDNKIITESQSPYSSPILLVKKKTGDLRLCVDYRALNAKTVKDRYPLPRTDEHLDRLTGCKFFTSLDLAMGYHQIPVAEKSRQKTAFITPDGHYEYLRMPFGLVNAPAVFQRTMNRVLGPLRFTQALAYMDDILIPSNDFETGLHALRNVLTAFKEANLTLKLSKCYFFQQKIDYLGHEISGGGIRPGTRKTRAVEDFPVPQNVHQIRQFVGLTSYFRKYIKDFALIARPLTQLTRKDVTFVWAEEQEQAFNELKTRLVNRPILTLYNPDAYTEVHTDASKWGIGGILMQGQNELHPVQYFSRQTTREEQRYHSYELETLAVVAALKQFRVYLLGLKFKVVTDCNAVRTTLTKRDLIPRIGRWWLQLQEFDFTVEYRPGAKMCHVDALSRNPIGDEAVRVFEINLEEDDWILSVQLQDPKCKDLIEILGHEPEDKEQKQVHADYVLNNHRLYRKTDLGLKWVVPKSVRRQIVKQNHDDKGHFGLDKTFDFVSESYWFSGMRRYIKKYITGCLECQYNKGQSGRKPGYLNPIEKIAKPMDTIHIDHLGPFVQTKRKNSYLLVVVDAFTKFVFMKAVQSTKVGPVLAFLDEIMETFGVPRRVICDRGTAFTCKKFVEYSQKRGFKTVYTATATPRANGQVERYNQTIMNSLTTAMKSEDQWDKVVSKVRFAMNSSVNTTTGKSAYELMFGYRPKALEDAFVKYAVATVDATNEVIECEEMRQQAADRIRKEQEKQKRNFDAKRGRPRQYTEGEHVLIKSNTASNDGKSKKTLPKYQGPFVVRKVLPHDRYYIEDLPGANRSQKPYKGTCAVDRMKPFTTQQETESDSDSDSSSTTNDEKCRKAMTSYDK